MAYPTKVYDVQSAEYSTMLETLAATKAAGDYVLHGETAGFYFVGGVSGDEVTIVTKSPRVKVERKSTETWVQGEALYHDPAGPYVSNVAAALRMIGYASESIAAAVTHGFMDFDGFAGELKA